MPVFLCKNMFYNMFLQLFFDFPCRFQKKVLPLHRISKDILSAVKRYVLRRGATQKG